MNIAFWDNQLCERGTTVSLFDYAYYNQTLLQNKSFIFYDKNRCENNTAIINKFKAHFTVHETDDFKEVDAYLTYYGITHIYIIKYGLLDTRLSQVAKNCIHCVFTCLEPHGDVYSSISPWVKGNADGRYPVVPHMINLPETTQSLRTELKIPAAAVVFGGYGGKDSFSIRFVRQVVYEVALKNPTIYFLFANFHEFCPPLPNIIHLPPLTDLAAKATFINTVDAMLWARQEGETFGIAIGEFSSKNKPVLATTNGGQGDVAHVHLLGAKGLWYTNAADLTNLLTHFQPGELRMRDWNAYADYTPEKVMAIFKRVFLE
jgi:hypothetical protein